MSFIPILFLKFYQKFVSPLLPASCRHYPTCSSYSIEAFQIHGFFTGLYLTVKRILKCNPFFEGGYDPVPEKKECSHNLKRI